MDVFHCHLLLCFLFTLFIDHAEIGCATTLVFFVHCADRPTDESNSEQQASNPCEQSFIILFKFVPFVFNITNFLFLAAKVIDYFANLSVLILFTFLKTGIIPDDIDFIYKFLYVSFALTFGRGKVLIVAYSLF